MKKDRILLVDDEDEFTGVLSERLEHRGIRVETVDSGPKALERVKAKDYDVVILDMAMPVMDGIETLKRLKQADPDLQVIILTGRATVDRGVKSMKLGATDFLEKPADIDELVGKIQQASLTKALLVEGKVNKKIEEILEEKGW